MMNKIALITGAGGEIGHGLIKRLPELNYEIIALDKAPLDEKLKAKVKEVIVGDILDKELIEKIFSENKIDSVFHLAGILSTSAEKNPLLAQKVNVEGTLNLLEAANQSGLKNKKRVKFIFPSSIAAYGLPDIESKNKADNVKENEFQNPITMYGINKLYSEMLGGYFSTNYNLLSEIDRSFLVDFRVIRFPGLLSADTLPTGGTSDYGSEMIHAAAQNKSYECFVREDTELPFMAMPDAVEAIISLNNSERKNLKQLAYNVTGFSVTAKELEERVKKNYPKFDVSYKVNEKRQMIVDSWPKSVDAMGAKRDWGFEAKYNFEKCMSDYLIPEIAKRYN